MCVYVCLYVEPVSRSKGYVRSCIKIGSVVCLYTAVLPSVPEREGMNSTEGTPGGVAVGDSDLCCCVLCKSSAIISLRSLILVSINQTKVHDTIIIIITIIPACPSPMDIIIIIIISCLCLLPLILFATPFFCHVLVTLLVYLILSLLGSLPISLIAPKLSL